MPVEQNARVARDAEPPREKPKPVKRRPSRRLSKNTLRAVDKTRPGW